MSALIEWMVIYQMGFLQQLGVAGLCSITTVVQHLAGGCDDASTWSECTFADDISLFSDSDHGLQLTVNKVTSNKFGLTMSLVKTEVQAVLRDTSQIKLHTKVGNSEVKQVQEFVSLDGTICSIATCDKDISRRIGIASGAARSLVKIQKAKDISKKTKLQIYRTVTVVQRRNLDS